MWDDFLSLLADGVFTLDWWGERSWKFYLLAFFGVAGLVGAIILFTNGNSGVAVGSLLAGIVFVILAFLLDHDRSH